MNTYDVAFAKCANYNRIAVEAAVNKCFEACSWQAFSSSNILVKPNMLKADPLSCTHPEVVRAVCVQLLDRGAKVCVADSPGFGRAESVSVAIGLDEALKSLGLKVESLDSPITIQLKNNVKWGIARKALECDHIFSLPRIKAHSQMRLTLSVKNLFGCICGLRKAFAHTKQGKDVQTFSGCIVDLWEKLPPSHALCDGVVCMHKTGPVNGQAFSLGLIGASTSAVALDTAIYQLLKVEKNYIPLWEELCRRDNLAANPHNIKYVLDKPTEFDASQFELPCELVDISFKPHKLALSLWRRFWSNLRA